jgi:hypothetical protein
MQSKPGLAPGFCFLSLFLPLGALAGYNALSPFLANAS